MDAYLEKHSLKDNTAILYLAGNGWDSAQGMPGMRAKLSPYELGVRTPMFVRWPAKVKPHRDDVTLASIVDFVPTILKMAGTKFPSDLPGLDLTDRAAMMARKSIFVEAYAHDIANLKDPANSLNARVVINGWSKLLIPGAGSPTMARAASPKVPELFDLKSDPAETNNLSEKNPQEVQRLLKLLDAWWKP